MENVGYLRGKLTDELTVERVARDAGVSRTTVYKALLHGQSVRSSIAEKLKCVLDPKGPRSNPAILREISYFVEECAELESKAARLSGLVEEATDSDPYLVVTLETAEMLRRSPAALIAQSWGVLKQLNDCTRSLEDLMSKARKTVATINAAKSRLEKISDNQSRL
jgi:AcrR family transcriptional regulator